MTKKSTKQPKDFAARLLAWREAKGYGRQEAAEVLKVRKRTLQEWEQRRRPNPRFTSIEHVLARLTSDGF